jgi:hypothetical protein
VKKVPKGDEGVRRLPAALMERIIYVVITLGLCSIPYFIPEITVRQGIIFFFGITIGLFLILMMIGMWISLRNSLKRKR